MAERNHNHYSFSASMTSNGRHAGYAEALPHLASDQPQNEAGRSPLRVLLVTARFLPFVGGTELHTYEVARRLVGAGDHATVLTTDPTGQLEATQQFDGIDILRVKAWPANRDYYWAPAIYRTIMEGQWDVIHCQGYHTLVAPLAMLAAYRSHTPYVVTFHSGGHSSRIRNAIRPVQRALLRPLLARANRLVGVSTFEAGFFRKRLRLPAERFAVIPNGANLPQSNNDQASTTYAPLIVSVGRLERYKGHHRVIAALPSIAKAYPDVRLRIIGTGPYESALRRLAHELGVANRLEICSVSGTDREGMEMLVSSASLMILLSDYESQSISVMEALALGRPVLVADTSALSEFAERGLARATPLGSTAEEVAGAVLNQLRSPLIPNDVLLPTWDGCFAQLYDLYHTVARR